MKRKINIIVILLVLTSMITMQSCKKASPIEPTQHYAFTTPVALAPVDGSTIKITGTTVDL
jgi:hypothetical protein